MKPEFKSTKVENIINVRHKVLRVGKPIESCNFQGDNDSTTLHFGIFKNHNTIACLSLMKAKHDLIGDKSSYQLRGMAVLPQYRGNNLGTQLLLKAEQHMAKSGVKTIWCNVRKTAIQFYVKNHYTQLGNVFDIPNVGPHVLMNKNL